MQLSGLILGGLGIFMIMDSSLSIVLGDRYMHWGLGYAPGFYQRLVRYIYRLPPGPLFGLKLFEMASGAVLLYHGLS